MKQLMKGLMFTMTLLLSHAAFAQAPQSILRLDTTYAFGGTCSDSECFDALLNERQIGVMIIGNTLTFVQVEENGEAYRVYLKKAQDCADSDSDPAGAREFFIDLERGIWSDEAKPLQGCAADLVS